MKSPSLTLAGNDTDHQLMEGAIRMYSVGLVCGMRRISRQAVNVRIFALHTAVFMAVLRIREARCGYPPARPGRRQEPRWWSTAVRKSSAGYRATSLGQRREPDPSGRGAHLRRWRGQASAVD